MWKDSALLLDVLIAAQKARAFAESESWETFRRNEILQNAVVRMLIIVGEAAGKISEETKAAHPEIPWKEIIGMRHHLVHEYFRIELDEVWHTLQHDLPTLIAAVEKLIPPKE